MAGSGRSGIDGLTDAARAYGSVENWRELLGLGEDTDPETVRSALQTVNTVLTRFNGAELTQLFAAYQQAITSFGLSEEQIQRLIRIRKLEEELQHEHELNAEYDSLVHQLRETEVLRDERDELRAASARKGVVIANLKKAKKIMETLKEGGVSAEEAELLSRELRELLAQVSADDPGAAAVVPAAADLKFIGARARRASSSSSSTVTIFRADVSSLLAARAPAVAAASGAEEGIAAVAAVVASTPCA